MSHVLFAAPIPQNSADQQIGYRLHDNTSITIQKGNMDSSLRNGMTFIVGY